MQAVGLGKRWGMTLASCPVPRWLFIAWCVYVMLSACLSGNPKPSNFQSEQALLLGHGLQAHFSLGFSVCLYKKYEVKATPR